MSVVCVYVCVVVLVEIEVFVVELKIEGGSCRGVELSSWSLVVISVS